MKFLLDRDLKSIYGRLVREWTSCQVWRLCEYYIFFGCGFTDQWIIIRCGQNIWQLPIWDWKHVGQTNINSNQLKRKKKVWIHIWMQIFNNIRSQMDYSKSVGRTILGVHFFYLSIAFEIDLWIEGFEKNTLFTIPTFFFKTEITTFKPQVNDTLWPAASIIFDVEFRTLRNRSLNRIYTFLQ